MQLKSNAHVHFIGICGTAMASLAGIMKSMGYRISGSDQNVYPPMSTQLADLGIVIQQGFKKENLNDRPDLVIVGNVVSRTNDEAQALLGTDIPYTSLPKAMGEFVIGARESIVIAGTHGKTTTTALAAWVSDSVGLNAGFLIGGIPINYGFSFRAPRGDTFIIEGDEYDTAFFDKVPKFIHYKPKYVILTSVEFDHADIYKDLDAVKDAFRRLLELIPEDGVLIYHADDKNIASLLSHCRAKRKFSYGLTQGDYQPKHREIVSGRNQFGVDFKGQGIGDLALKIFGQHNTLNALAVFAMGHTLKWPLGVVLQGMAGFQGVKRRQEILGEPNGVTVIEDFAHHPTAVRMTLASIREHYPKRRLIAVFEPRSATSRRKVFQKDYVEAFLEADQTFLAAPYDQSKIAESERFSTEELANDIRAKGRPATSSPNVTELLKSILAVAKKGDVIVLMSNGGFENIYQKLLAAL